jgi:hypothetical protein
MNCFIPIFTLLTIFSVSKQFKRFFIVKCAIASFLLLRMREIDTDAARQENALKKSTNQTLDYCPILQPCPKFQLQFMALHRQLAFILNMDFTLDMNVSIKYKIVMTIVSILCISVAQKPVFNFAMLLVMYGNLITLSLNCVLMLGIAVFYSAWPGDIILPFPIGLAPFLFVSCTLYEYIVMINYYFPIHECVNSN